MSEQAVCKKCGDKHRVEQFKHHFFYYYCPVVKRVLVLSDECQIKEPEVSDEHDNAGD
jgi:hypothetical protein